MDIASLGFKIDTSDIARANSNLDQLSNKGQGAQKAASTISDAWSQAANKIASNTDSIVNQLSQMNAAQTQTTLTLQRISQQLSDSSAAFSAQASAAEKSATAVAQVGAASDDAAQRLSAMVQQSLAVVSANSGIIESQTSLAQRSAEAAAALDRQSESTINWAKEQAQANSRAQAFLAAEERVARAAQQNSQAQQAQADAIEKVMDKLYPAASALKQVEQWEETLSNGFKSGAISAAQYADAMAEIAKRKDAIEGINTSANSASDGLHKLSLNSSQARVEIGRLANDLLNGNFGRFEQTSLTLANYMGLLGAAMSPVGIGIAGVAGELIAFGAAANSAYQDTKRFNESIAESGNYAGATAGSLESVAEGIGAAAGKWNQARDIVSQLVESGKLGAQSLQSVAQATMDIVDLTGKSAQEASQQALQGFDGTTQGLLKLNEQYNFLTDTIYDQVKALQEEGDEQDAVRVAAQAFHDQIEPRIQAMTQDVYGLAKMWGQVKIGLSDYWEELKNGSSLLAGTASIDNQIYALMGRKQTAQEGGFSAIVDGVLGQGFSSEDEAKLQQLLARRNQIVQEADDQATRAALSKNSVSASSDLDALAQSVDKLSAKDQAIKRLNKDFDELWGSASLDNARLAGVQRIVGDDGSVSFAGGEYDKLLADINKKYKQSGGVSDNTIDLTSANKDLSASIKDDVKQYQEQLKQWSQNTVAVNQYRDALNEKLKTDQAAIDLQVMSVGMGQQQYAMQRQLIQAQEDYDNQRQKLDRDYADKSKGISYETYQQQLSDLKDYNAQRIQQINSGNQKMLDAQGDWLLGAKQGWEDFETDANNVAKGVASTVSDAFGAFTDDLVTTLNTGKLSFHSFATSVLEDIERIGLKLAEEQGVKAILSAFNIGSSSDTWSSLAASFSAKGNVFSGGDISKYSGSIVSSPTMFSGTHITAFASGGNVMGEAGPEAILPLRRGADGKLGVASSSSSGGVTINVTTNVDASGSASTSVSSSDQSSAYTALSQQLAALCRQQISKSIQPGGLIYNWFKGR